MATAIDFTERNDIIGKPADMSDNQCYGIPVCRMLTYIPGPTDQDEPLQVAAHVSCWELDEAERAEVARSGKVYVKILGHTLFPMGVHGIKPIHTGEGKLVDIVPQLENKN